MALRALGLIEGAERGLELLSEAVETLIPSPARLELARALVDLGAALRRANQRAAARDSLYEGLDIAHRCGAVPLAERAREELLAAGSRPRRLVRRGVASLTPSEHRVAQMAAEGMTNPQIAQALFVTRKTVEAHLLAVYRKLDISGRGELERALAEQAPVAVA
jgi:DNA-binding CsgD family transcriptional regulator